MDDEGTSMRMRRDHQWGWVVNVKRSSGGVRVHCSTEWNSKVPSCPVWKKEKNKAKVGTVRLKRVVE